MDLNGDGKTDVVVGYLAGTIVGVLLGNGSGSFATAVNYTVGSAPRAVKVGDLNGDGKLDLVTANVVSNTVSVLLGDGLGGFATAASYPTGGGSSRQESR